MSSLDPGHFLAPARTGEVARLARHVLRVVAPNPGPLTGPGTNTYVIGSDAGCVVVDPGPDDPGHVERVLAAAPGPVVRILCTHSHTDHSPGAVRLRAASGAPVFGRPAPADDYQDDAYAPDRSIEEGDVFDIGPSRLRAVHTPGHASNHVCFLLEAEGWLLTGDHLMSGSTVVILPPDGSMQLYLKSLQQLRALPVRALLPGHGAVIPDALQEIDRVIAHRIRRESKVLAALRRSASGATVAALVPVVYDDTPVALHVLAQHSLLAHLQKLLEEGRARREGDAWSGVAE
jgi:glyoxylase-like metal-dependent hydrolase (beta-lactamase superfamily II)